MLSGTVAVGAQGRGSGSGRGQFVGPSAHQSIGPARWPVGPSARRPVGPSAHRPMAARLARRRTSSPRRDLRHEIVDRDLLYALAADHLLAVLLELVPPAALGQLLAEQLLQALLLPGLLEALHDALPNGLVLPPPLLLQIARRARRALRHSRGKRSSDLRCAAPVARFRSAAVRQRRRRRRRWPGRGPADPRTCRPGVSGGGTGRESEAGSRGSRPRRD